MGWQPRGAIPVLHEESGQLQISQPACLPASRAETHRFLFFTRRFPLRRSADNQKQPHFFPHTNSAVAVSLRMIPPAFAESSHLQNTHPTVAPLTQFFIAAFSRRSTARRIDASHSIASIITNIIIMLIMARTFQVL